MPNNEENKRISRPPVVVIMGHIDHGKSTLLDFIRKSNIVAKEAGGITQHLGAYEIEHKAESGVKKITFLDTPGHEAFQGVRSRGANVADIGILIISAEDGVKPQTKEALRMLLEAKIPFIVAINKIDSPKANVDSAKTSLIENEIYIEGYGGTIPCVEISAKTGQNINELLDTILLVAEMENFEAAPNELASGFVVESRKDKTRGIQATLVIKGGEMTTGQFVASQNAFAPIRLIEDCNKKAMKNATFSAPVSISGWDEMPQAGSDFKVFKTKKEAEFYISNWQEIYNSEKKEETEHDRTLFVIPVLIKADTQGSLEAIEHEMKKIELENARIKIIDKSTGNIGETEIKLASGNENTIVVGFGVNVDSAAVTLGERLNINIKTFKIIYELTDWLKVQVEERRPRIEEEEIKGEAKILKTFSRVKNIQVCGAKVKQGVLKLGNKVKILRRDEEIGIGTIKELQSQKMKASEVTGDIEFGMSLECKLELAPGDHIQAVELIKR